MEDHLTICTTKFTQSISHITHLISDLETLQNLDFILLHNAFLVNFFKILIISQFKIRLHFQSQIFNAVSYLTNGVEGIH